ncbi:MAG TPA: hypothetical protein VGG74_34070 [Kofleriaceae bacterium]|jgi:hypothetical protein
MRVVLGSLALLALASCDPPPPQYPQYRYGNDPSQDPNPPPAYSNDPNAPPSTYPQPQSQPQPPPPGQQPPHGYTSTSPQPGYTTTVVPGYSGPPPQTPAGPPAPEMPPPTSAGPPPAMQSPSSIAAGQYTCWQVGMGGYVASTLVSVSLNPDGTYQVAGYKNAGGSYRTDTISVYLTGGPLNGWIGAIGANAKGPLVRFRPDTPNNPGNEMHQGDHLCFLRF